MKSHKSRLFSDRGLQGVDLEERDCKVKGAAAAGAGAGSKELVLVVGVGAVGLPLDRQQE